MKRERQWTLLLLVLGQILITGCTKPYKILQDLERPVSPAAACSVGSITDELPIGFDEAKKPSVEDIQKFKNYLAEEMQNREVLTVLLQGDHSAEYMIDGAILDYKKGSGFLRFLFGYWAGGAEVTVTLKLVDTETNEVIFSGNFKGSVTSWAESGDKMFKGVAKDFTKQLAKRIKKMNENE